MMGKPANKKGARPSDPRIQAGAASIQPSPAPRTAIQPFPPPGTAILPFPRPGTLPGQIFSLESSVIFTPSQLANMSIAGKVKSILSGDTLVLTSINNPSKEKIICLAWISTPFFRKDNEEPFAFASREFLREALVGKTVIFQPYYQIPSTAREHGIVTTGDEVVFPLESVKAGWAKVRDDAGRPSEDVELAKEKIAELRKSETEARDARRGIWSGESGVIEIQKDVGDPAAFLQKYKGESIDGLVERVLSGDRMLIRLKLSPAKHIIVMILVAGIRAPSTERINPTSSQVQPAEECGNESKLFVEGRLLQRNVIIGVVGLSPQNQLIAVIMHRIRGNIALHALEAGMARCYDHHSTLLGAEMAPLRKAESDARESKMGVHKGYVAKAGTSSSDATVSKVFSADTIFVWNKAGIEKKISISSVKGPKRNEPTEAPFHEEAKEFLRKKLIGKHIRMSIDGSRPGTGDFEAKEVATIMLSDKNIGLILVQEGFCSVIRHKREDPDRAPNYDDLLSAQEKAKEDKKGMWSGKPSSAKSYADASATVQKAKIHVATLKNKGKMPAIVDFVKSGSRFTVLVPREYVKLNFVLGGIRAPKSARNPNDKGEPFGQDAHDFAVKRCNQRDVEIIVHDIDKVGGFIGELYVNRESFAKILVEEGLATVHAFSAESSGNANELFAAEERAKGAKRNLWKDSDPFKDAAEEFILPDRTNGPSDTVPHKKDYRDVQVSYLIPETGKIILQYIHDKRQPLTSLMSSLQTSYKNTSNSAGLPGPPKVGEMVATQYSEDNAWYRGKIRSNDRTAKVAEVQYIDWGNTEKVAWSKLRPLTPELQKLKPQCFEAVLSCVSLPSGTEYFDGTLGTMEQLSSGFQLVAMVDSVAQDGTISVTLYKSDDVETDQPENTINAQLIAEGYAFVSKQLKPFERNSMYLKAMENAQVEAFDAHRGMWQYGDPTQDD